MSKLAISYRKNPPYDQGHLDAPRLFATIKLAQYGIDARVTALPIYFRNLERFVGPLRVVYSTRIAGLDLEAGNLEALATTIDSFLNALVKRDRLPTYVFNVGDSAWPIYRFGDELVTRYPGGPVFGEASIAELWIALADHFKHIGRIESRRDLGILYFSQVDLQLYAPEFSLRFPTAADIPVFPVANGHGPELIAPVGRQVLRLAFRDGEEIVAMYRLVAGELVRRGQLAGPYDMSIRKLANERWAQASRHLKPTGRALVYHAEERGRLDREHLPILSDGSGYMAARQSRPSRVTVYAGPDLEALQARVGEELYGRGVINSPGAVYVGAAGAKAATGSTSMLDQVLRRDLAFNR
jgi:hypothetical protein